MQLTIITDLALGDGGKGKTSDICSADADLVVRVQGGGNAGHSVQVGAQTFKFHHLPCGIVRGVPCLLGNGMVIDPIDLVAELAQAEKDGLDATKVVIDGRAHIVFPQHKQFDRLQELRREWTRDGRQIGTTNRGIGPCSADKYARTGLRFWDAQDNDRLREAYIKLTNDFQDIRRGVIAVGENIVCPSDLATLQNALNKLKHRIVDGRQFIKGFKSILVEGAQGYGLDIDSETYPFVTSSTTTSAGAFLGTGLSIKDPRTVIGVTKAYSSYVGNGHFVAEMDEETANVIREKGKEYGTTTGRPRRVGWLDLVMLKEAVHANGTNLLALTKLDILSGLPEVKVVAKYNLRGQLISYIPGNPADFAECKASYITLPGWQEDISQCKDWRQLPRKAQDFVHFVVSHLGVPLHSISVGPERTQTMLEVH